MDIIFNILKSIPLNSVLREKVLTLQKQLLIAETKVSVLEAENLKLKTENFELKTKIINLEKQIKENQEADTLRYTPNYEPIDPVAGY